MYYKVELSTSTKKFIKKLDGSYKEKVIKFLEYLEKRPIPLKKKHILELAGSSMLCEYPLDKLRFYYTIENQFVVIENIKYSGLVEVLKGYSNHKSGNKNYPNQQKDIKQLKKDFDTKNSK